MALWCISLPHGVSNLKQWFERACYVPGDSEIIGAGSLLPGYLVELGICSKFCSYHGELVPLDRESVALVWRPELYSNVLF